ncbi:PI-PLC X domain-containing protein 1 [Colletotrichum siamense]|uniref:PI-PLC X domain-containing protein 1 n=1 Tax=Colletotrichum siamense TaxID=690259 RepID=UPI0018721F8C|nr:PI-PLC X domain-containing protein 1 [Colletotrichum siamense]KAF5497055.1 PI-PLC X domain-containing protein 1 [Colletotrichum siamense]
MRIIHLLVCLVALGLTDARKCNGHEHLCNRKYSNVTFVGSHNANFVGERITHNQNVPITRQLDIGVRFLTIQTHWKDDEIRMCHSKCWLLDVGKLEDFLLEVSRWMKNHPNEVVTLLLTNPTSIRGRDFAAAFRKAGVDKIAFTPNKKLAVDSWPTLGQLIDNKKRLVVFMDYPERPTREKWIMDWFSYSWETPYGELDNNFPHCKRDRPQQHIDESKYMYLINHVWNKKLGTEFEGESIKIPTRLAANTTNSMDSISRQVKLCKAKWGKIPNVILLDFIDVGDAIKAQDHFNS